MFLVFKRKSLSGANGFANEIATLFIGGNGELRVRKMLSVPDELFVADMLKIEAVEYAAER
jgi:hypothetical protein